MHASYIDQRGIELCLENGIVLNPTLTLLVNTLEAEKKMPIELSRSLDPVKRELDAAVENLQRAYDAGIPFVAGSESGWSSVPYGHWHAKEMSLYVEYFGMSPLEAIYTGTGGAAHILPKLKDKVGILEEGRFADILLVRGEPDKNIGLLADRRNFERIWKNGELVDREEPAKRERMWYEKEIVILNGLYEYDPDKGEGVIRK